MLLSYSLRRVVVVAQRRLMASQAKGDEERGKRERGETVRRSLLNVPGSEERKMKKSEGIGADTVVLDLEDGVAMGRKEAARSMVALALSSPPLLPASERAVRINHVGSGLEHLDLQAILPSPHLHAILIPKVEQPAHIRYVADVIDYLLPPERRAHVKLLAAIESARGILNLREICQADPRLEALIFASEDYVADTGMIRTSSRKELFYARSSLVTHAAAYGLQAIDLVCVDYQDIPTLREECLEGRELGFTGKQAIHPNQVPVIQDLFSPSPQEIEKAKRIIEGYEKHLQEGIGAFNLDGKMIDLPVVKWAEKIISRAQKAGKI